MIGAVDGYLVARGAFDVTEVRMLRAGVENAVAGAVALAEAAESEGITLSARGNQL